MAGKVARSFEPEANLLGLRAYETLFASIQSGRLKPGSLVRETELTLWLGMSRTPLREALQRLENQGLLRFEAQRGIRIAQLSASDLADLYTAREWSEGAAAALAAHHVNEGDIAMLRELLDLEEAAADDTKAGARFNRKFHRAIHACARNDYIAAHLESLNARLALIGEATRRSSGRYREALSEHRAIVDAIERHDALAAEQSARAHIRASRRFVLANKLREPTP